MMRVEIRNTSCCLPWKEPLEWREFSTLQELMDWIAVQLPFGVILTAPCSDPKPALPTFNKEAYVTCSICGECPKVLDSDHSRHDGCCTYWRALIYDGYLE